MFSVYCGKCLLRKAVHNWVANVSLTTKRLKRRWWKWLRQQSKRLLCCGFRRTGKAMGQVYQCWWGICREINVFLQVRMLHIMVLWRYVTHSRQLPSGIWHLYSLVDVSPMFRKNLLPPSPESKTIPCKQIAIIPENGNKTLLLNICEFLVKYLASHPWRWNSSWPSPCEHEISDVAHSLNYYFGLCPSSWCVQIIKFRNVLFPY
jgi:hypothetical protein